MLSASGVFDFIQQQSPIFVNKLYGNTDAHTCASQAAWVCRGVLQALSPLAKCYVMRLIFIEVAISSVDILNWCEQDRTREHDSAIKELLQLRVFSEVETPPGAEVQKDEQWFILNQYFRSSIKYSMVHLTQPWREEPAVVQAEEGSSDKGAASACAGAPGPTCAELEVYSLTRWNTILEFLVTADRSLPVSARVVTYLLAAGLMQEMGGSAAAEAGDAPALKRARAGTQLSITASGYEYMLLDIQSQVWLFVQQCLTEAAAGGGSGGQADLLGLVFMLSFCRAGQGYPLRLLSPPQRLLLGDLCAMGLVYVPAMPQSSSALFYPTHIAIGMLSVPPPAADMASSSAPSRAAVRDNALGSLSLSIIVETNFQVVAYVTSSLHLAMLSLFVDTRTMIRLPNMVLGNITRDSAKAAFRLGITAQQITGFLITHAHPLPAHTSPVIPENVSDQLRLWQAEKKRFSCLPALVVDLHDVAQGPRLAVLYDRLVGYAKDMQVLVWANAQLREFGVTPEGFRHVQAYAETLE